jgi:hypothetical protein
MGHWATRSLKWGDIEPLRHDIRAAEVAANPSAYMGEKACFKGAIDRWSGTSLVRVHLYDSSRHRIHALVVRHFPDVERGQQLQVCGFIMGRHGKPATDPNAGAALVGMVDTPENRGLRR